MGLVVEDKLLQTIDVLKEAQLAVRSALDAAVDAVETVRRDRTKGVPLAQLADSALGEQGRETRRRVAEAIADYEHAMMIFRATLIREFVDDQGLTFSEVARRMGISRQMVARLYKS